MEKMELRPMGIGDIIDGTLRLYRSRFGTFMLIVLAAYVPFSVIMALIQAFFVGAEANPDAAFESLPPAAIVVGAISFLIFILVINPLCQGAMVHNISAGYLGEHLGVAESYRRALPRLVTLLLANLLAGIIIAVGFLLLIVPGVIFSLWFALIPAAAMLENTSPTGAIGRSKALTSGNLGKVFLLGLAMFALLWLFMILINIVVAMIPWPHPMVEGLFSTLVQALVVPIQIAPFILLYYDLRIRKEAFDLEHLAAAVEAAPSYTLSDPE